MSASRVDGPGVIEARVVHKASNALSMTFFEGPGDPFATAVQGAGDGRGKKLGVLFGFKNGGAGKHRLTYRDGSVLNVESKDGAPSVFADADGTAVATVRRGDTSIAALPDGRELFSFVPQPEDAKTPELFRLRVTRAGGGEQLGSIDVVRKAAGWSLGRALDAAYDQYLWFDRAGQALPVPILGVRLYLDQQPDPAERNVLLGACVDMAIGLRPYIAAMR